MGTHLQWIPLQHSPYNQGSGNAKEERAGRDRGPGLSSLYVREAVPMRAQEYCCLDRTQTMNDNGIPTRLGNLTRPHP